MRAPSVHPATQPPPVLPEVVTEATEHALALLAHGRGHIVLMAPAGYGKTSALQQLERGGQTLGLRLHRYAPEDPHHQPDVVVVDDAHLLPADAVHRLTALAHSGTRVLAAAKPPPPGGSLGPGLEQLADSGDVVTLEPWLVDEVESMLRLRGDDAWATLDAEAVVQLTGGLPWLVAKLLDDPASVGRSPRPGQPTGPERQVLRMVDRLPPRVGEVLMALCAGYPVDRGPLPQPLRDLGAAQLRDLLDRLYDAGVLTRHGHVPPLVRQAVLLHVPRHRIRAHLSESLLDDLLVAGVDLEPIAADLAGAGLRDARLAAALEARGEATLDEDPAQAAALLLAAAHCGGDGLRLAVRQSEALALSGDLGAAAAVLDSLPDGLDGGGAGLRVAATVSVLSGRLHDAAALGRWAAEQQGLLQAGRAIGVAAYALYGDGSRDQADALLAADHLDRPALTGSPMLAMASAVRTSLTEDPSAALSALVQASRGSVGRRELLPDQPATLGALVALHGGDLAMADSLLASAQAQRGGLLPADRSRTLALRAWTSMQAGQYAEAHAHLAHLADLAPTTPRDEPWVWALRVGLARRQDDVRALARHWVDARGVMVGHPVDLYSLLPLGEMGLAAARMGETELAEPLWGRAMDLLAGLGTPPLWAPAFHWYGVQAAILTNRPKAMAPHAAVLVAAARSSPFAAALARAGRAWIAVLGRQVDPAQVEPAARGLASVGQLWEGARLAGHAAARAADKKDTAALLECARDLLASTTSPEPGHTATASTEWRTGAVPLSRREREVVELVLAGMTYRQIGETLYLSAKTVEHHIARIKRRSGVSTRSELLDRLSITVG